MEPVRTCVGCRQRANRADLTRVVARKSETGSESELILDLNSRMPGRGAWLHASAECLRLAIERRAFGRALRIGGNPNAAGLNF